MLKLYGGARSRASIVKWYLEELAIDYKFVLLDMQAREHLKPEFLAINPMGKVPAIADGDFCLWESGAILLYLAQKYEKIALSIEQLAQINQWILFANSTLAIGVFVEANREREMPRLLTALDGILAHQPYLLKEEFTVADVAVGSILAYIPLMLKLDLSAYQEVTSYMQRLGERPAFQKAMSM
ncbi:glutathione S-transferase family protein [Synechocystis sp. PCC 7509]|uniref:glutathione S-transferase family protein n=1 Tax=Synechocystis sp. PCC 7509 TaxID=927677 RepID=UPI0002AC439E|nr:glutathione S-transferase family protein [Synechocystis sp. PCC 7509]